MDEYPVSKLSGPQGRVLFALLLTRQREGSWSIAEFTLLVGLESGATRSALPELSSLSLIAILPHNASESLVSNSAEQAQNPPFPQDEVEKVLTDKQQQDVRLQGMWDEVFPVEEYPYQRLTVNQARRWINAHGFEFMVEVFEEIKDYSKAKPQWPRSYVEKVIEKKRAWDNKKTSTGTSTPNNGIGEDDGRGGITPELKELLKVRQRQYGKKSEAG